MAPRRSCSCPTARRPAVATRSPPPAPSPRKAWTCRWTSSVSASRTPPAPSSFGIAKAGGGRYADAQNGDELAGRMRRLAQRALRGQTPVGVPVPGTEDAAVAPVLKPGAYLDEMPPGGGVKRHYAFDLPEGATAYVGLRIGVTAPLGERAVIGSGLSLVPPGGGPAATRSARPPHRSNSLSSSNHLPWTSPRSRPPPPPTRAPSRWWRPSRHEWWAAAPAATAPCSPTAATPMP